MSVQTLSTAADLTDVLTDALTRAVVALGRAGEPEAASRIAARAYADLRIDAPRAAEQLNNVLHGLSRMPGMPRRPSPPNPSQPDQGEPHG